MSNGLTLNGFLNLKMKQPISFSSDTINVTNSNVDLIPIGGNNILTTINGGTNGDILFISLNSSAANNVIMNEIGGNIRLTFSDTFEFRLNSNDNIILIYDGTNWREINRSYYIDTPTVNIMIAPFARNISNNTPGARLTPYGQANLTPKNNNVYSSILIYMACSIKKICIAFENYGNGGFIISRYRGANIIPIYTITNSDVITGHINYGSNNKCNVWDVNIPDIIEGDLLQVESDTGSWGPTCLYLILESI